MYMNRTHGDFQLPISRTLLNPAITGRLTTSSGGSLPTTPLLSPVVFVDLVVVVVVVVKEGRKIQNCWRFFQMI